MEFSRGVICLFGHDVEDEDGHRVEPAGAVFGRGGSGDDVSVSEARI